MVEAMRSLDPHACCRLVGERLGKGEFRAQAAWDAVHLMAGELMIRQPGIYGIHTVTSANALHTAYQLAALPATRLLLLLQAVGWMVQFREFMATTRGGLNKSDILVRPPGRQVKPRPDDSRSAIEAVLGAIGQDAGTAAAAARGLGELAAASKQPALLGDFASAVRQLIARKATDAHHYKYGMAIFENLDRVSPAFRPHVLAAAPYFLRGRKDPDTPVVTRALDALGAG